MFRLLQHLVLFLVQATLIHCCAFSQTALADSLIRLLPKVENEAKRMSLNFDISNNLLGYDKLKAELYLEAGYKLAKASNNADYIAYYFREKGGLLFELAKYNEAVSYYDSGLIAYNRLIDKETDITKQKKYKYGKIDCLIGKGLLAAKLYHYNES